ncbi:MAG: hypothetical protein F6K11_20765 [Leptolyngbya sp. SIO3F4]|nr:hypothetical protein [Leptolyngbya sp. SIO3F4]
MRFIYFVLLVSFLVLSTGTFDIANASGEGIFLQENFENYSFGTTEFPTIGEENCKKLAGCPDSTCPKKPLVVSRKHSKTGKKSLRFIFNKNNKVNHNNGYCAFRNEIRYDNLNLPYGSEAWFAWSLYPEVNYEKKIIPYMSNGDSWITQFKTASSGNTGGIQIRKNNKGYFFSTGKDGVNLGPVNFNKWNDIVIRLRYEGSDRGGRTIWLNGEKYFLPEAYENEGDLDFKLGLYGWQPDGRTIHYIDNVVIVKGASNYETMRNALNNSVSD